MHRGDQRREQADQHGRRVLDSALLAFHEPRANHDGPHGAAKEQPLGHEPLRIGADCREGEGGEPMRTPPPTPMSTQQMKSSPEKRTKSIRPPP